MSVRNDCRTFRMDDENEREREPRRTPADTVILIPKPNSQELRVEPTTCKPATRATAGEGCYSKTLPIAISRCATFDP